MKKLMLLILLTITLIVPTKVDAAMCPREELRELSYKANEAIIEYEHTGYGMYNITIKGLQDSFYVEDANSNGNIRFDYYGESEVKMTDKIEGSSFVFKFYGSQYTDCEGRYLREVTINLPYYNWYYEEAICNDLQEFYYCSKFADTRDIEPEQLYKEIEEYKKEKAERNAEKNKPDDPERNFFQRIYDYVVEHYILVSAITLVFGTGIFLLIRYIQRKRSFI